jgi:hypothetical protein
MKPIIIHSIELLLEFPAMIFDRRLEKRNPIGAWGWLLLLYLIGLVFWGTFFDWRRAPLNFLDWSETFLPRFEAVRDAINYRMLPLHVNCASCLHGFTDRFFVLPDVVTTPQMLVMSIVDVDTFAVLDLLLHYTIATVGLIALRRQLQLSLISYSFMFFLFNFNGYIQSHYAVGHLSWAGYFLFPFFFLLILQLLDHQPSWRWVTGISFLSFYMILAGSQHHFTWLMLFLVFLALSHRLTFKWIVAAILFSGFLSAIRLLPPVLGFNDFADFKFRFRTGYHTLYDFFNALVVLREPNFLEPAIYKYTTLNYWEFDYFVGFAGGIFIIYFGVIDWLKGGGQCQKYLPLFIPALLIFLLSQGQIYKYTLFNFPIFSSERVASRMVSVPITLFIIMGAAQLQELLEINKSRFIRWLSAGGLVLVISEVYTHIVTWNVNKVGELFGGQKLQFPGNSIVNHPDPLYIMVLWIGLTLTLLSAVALAVLVWRENRGKQLK